MCKSSHSVLSPILWMFLTYVYFRVDELVEKTGTEVGGGWGWDITLFSSLC